MAHRADDREAAVYRLALRGPRDLDNGLRVVDEDEEGRDRGRSDHVDAAQAEHLRPVAQLPGIHGPGEGRPQRVPAFLEVYLRPGLAGVLRNLEGTDAVGVEDRAGEAYLAGDEG